MSYEEFVKFVQSQCMHEAIYEDSEGRSILVVELLDAYGMANKFIEAEREECAKLAENTKAPFTATAIRARGEA